MVRPMITDMCPVQWRRAPPEMGPGPDNFPINATTTLGCRPHVSLTGSRGGFQLGTRRNSAAPARGPIRVTSSWMSRMVTRLWSLLRWPARPPWKRPRWPTRNESPCWAQSLEAEMHGDEIHAQTSWLKFMIWKEKFNSVNKKSSTMTTQLTTLLFKFM